MQRPKRKADLSKLAEEAKRWDSREATPAGWTSSPNAVPRAHAAQIVSLRLPRALLEVLKELAAREGIGYQVLIKRWLDERVRSERDRLQRAVSLGDRRVVRIPPSPHVAERVKRVESGSA